MGTNYESTAPSLYARDNQELATRQRRVDAARKAQAADGYRRDFMAYVREAEAAEAVKLAPVPTARQTELARVLQRADSYRREWTHYQRAAAGA